MNNKEFITELSSRLNYTNKDASDLVQSIVAIMTECLQEGHVILIHGFGSFEIKKKMERLSVNPVTKKRLLIPPKLVLTYKPSTILKDRFK